MLFYEQDIEKVAKFINENVNAPFVNCKYSMLGGIEHLALVIYISLEPKSQWANGIYQNSTYMIFDLMAYDGRLEQTHRQYTIKNKFKTRKVNSVEEAVIKINEYINPF